jgi:alpha-glucuronidase
VAVQYFDLQGGAAKFALLVNGKQVEAWTADAELLSRRPHGDNSIRRTVRGVELKAGDVVRVEGVPDGKDGAALDYLEVSASAN